MSLPKSQAGLGRDSPRIRDPPTPLTDGVAAHIELDEILNLIVSGLADPQEHGERQAAQYLLSVQATCGLARAFNDEGYDVAFDDALEPEAFDRCWQPLLDGLAWKLVVVLPSLDETPLDPPAARSR